MITTVLFDIDDTLYDQARPFKQALSQTLPEITLAEDMTPLYIRFRHHCDEIFVDFSAGKISLKDSHYVRINAFHQEIAGEALSMEQAERFQECYEQALATISLTKEMSAILTQLANQGLTLGVISNGPAAHQWKKVRQLGLLKWFPKERIWVSGDVGIAKPNPEIFKTVQAQLGAKASEILYVGDSFENDIAATAKVGWQSIWFNHRRRPLPEGYQELEYAEGTVYDVRALADCLIRYL